MKNILILIVIVAVWCFGPAAASAQATKPQFLLTWRAGTAVPPDYRGRPLPSPESIITASIELIDRGKPADLSRQTIYWYVENKLVSNSPGSQKITFTAPRTAQPIDLRVELPDWNGASLLKTITIPVVQPEVVIDAPFPGGRVGGSAFRVTARPYFFNIAGLNSLLLLWSANGKPVEELAYPEPLNVVLDPATSLGSAITIALNVRNPFRASEAAQKTVNVIFQR